MNNTIRNIRTNLGIQALLIFIAVTSSWATIHVVQFGGSAGFEYSPKTFTASVGDTVQWNGSFSFHPISSTSVPTNAQTWHTATGTTFIYVIQVAGSYSYQCDLHVGLGMIGSFEVTGSGVKYFATYEKSPDKIAVLGIDQSAHPTVSFNVPRAGIVTVEIFDLLGNIRAIAAKGKMDAGIHTVSLDAQLSNHGYYFIKIAGDGAEIVQPFRIVN
jgi:plastocyanin